jgi:hypothetical protein
MMRRSRYEAYALRDLKLCALDKMGHGEHGSRLLGASLRRLTGPTQMLTEMLDGVDAAAMMALPEPEPGYALGPAAGEGTAAQVASRRELTGMKLSALRRRAQAEGVDDGAMEAASDGDDERRDLVQLIMAQQQPWDDQGAAVDSEQLELRAKLGSLKMSALRRRAVADGVRSEQMDAAADGDDERASLVAAIVERAVAEGR